MPQASHDSRARASSAALTSLAILKVNWDTLGRDYIENFVPFVAEALRNSTADVVSLPDLQVAVRDQFGLDIPLNPLRQVLKRCSKRGYVRKASGVYHREISALDSQEFTKVRDTVIVLHDRLVRQLRDFAKAEHQTDWDDGAATDAIHSFIADQGLPLLYSRAEQSEFIPPRESRKSAYIVAAFVIWSRANSAQSVDDLCVLVKGQLLATSLFLPDPASVAQRFRDTHVLLDSSIIIYALGHAGPERQAPCAELIDSLRTFGATIACFHGTLSEVRGILDACAARLRTGHIRDSYGPSMEWFIESGRSASDVELMIARLPEKLRALGVATVEFPPVAPQFQVEVQGFESALQAETGYKNKKAREHDADCVSAIAQLRRGDISFRVEDCRALFVTTNSGLARLARAYYQPEVPEGAVALCSTDYALGNLLWLKNPTRAPNLPTQRLIADAYAALQPPDALWKVYLAEIARLQESGKITADEYYALRHSLTAKRALMDLTAGDAAAFSEGTVHTVLKVATENIRADLQKTLIEEQQKRRGAESTVTDLEARENARRARLVSLSDTWASRIVRIGSGVLMVVLGVGAFLSFPWSVPRLDEAWFEYVRTTMLAALFAFTIANIRWGTSVGSVEARVRPWLSSHIQRLLVRMTGETIGVDLLGPVQGAAKSPSSSERTAPADPAHREDAANRR
jgi:hypothetical protein